MQVHHTKSTFSIKQIISKEHELSEERVKTMLTAGILRYLQGRASLSFITDLSTEVSNKYDPDLHGDLLEVVSLLNFLGYQSKYLHLSSSAVREKLQIVLGKLDPQNKFHKN